MGQNLFFLRHLLINIGRGVIPTLVIRIPRSVNTEQRALILATAEQPCGREHQGGVAGSCPLQWHGPWNFSFFRGFFVLALLANTSADLRTKTVALPRAHSKLRPPSAPTPERRQESRAIEPDQTRLTSTSPLPLRDAASLRRASARGDLGEGPCHVRNTDYMGLRGIGDAEH